MDSLSLSLLRVANNSLVEQYLTVFKDIANSLLGLCKGIVNWQEIANSVLTAANSNIFELDELKTVTKRAIGKFLHLTSERF